MNGITELDLTALGISGLVDLLDRAAGEFERRVGESGILDDAVYSNVRYRIRTLRALCVAVQDEIAEGEYPEF